MGKNNFEGTALVNFTIVDNRKELDKAEPVFPEGKDKDSEYTKSEAQEIGLQDDKGEKIGNEIIEHTDATCTEKEYTKKECTRCHDVVEEYGKYRSENGQHDYVKHWVQQLTCTEDGESDGEFCSICGQKNPASKEEYFEHQGHKVKAWVQTFGKVRNGTTRQGTPIELTNYRSVHECVNCGAVLGIEEWTVATCSKPPKLEIASGANAKIDDISGGIHISGNMANDGGVTFNQIVLDEVTEFVNDGKISSKYTYKKTKSHSFIIEFSKMFLDELEDGTYPVEIVNGHEYWPLMVTVEGHKLVAVSDQEYPIGDEITKAQLDEHLAQAEAEGAVIKELFVVPLAEEDLDGMVFPEAKNEEPDNESENDSGDPERSDDDGKEADNSKAEGGSASSNPNTGSTAPAMCAAVILLGAIVMTHKRKQ
ncbi:MAG: NPXTG-anchored protein [Ruminococcus sp.]|nr:NPXTG-anchored protein [Ruminococcus sp.]